MNGLIQIMRWLLTVMLLLTTSMVWSTRLSLPDRLHRKEVAMGNNNGIITSPINLETDVYKVLGLGSQNGYYDVGYACSNEHGKINISSRYKPVNSSILGILSKEQFKTLCYGFGDVISSSDISQRKWGYIPPTDAGFYRLTDFDNYNHRASNFCSITLPTTIKGTQVNKASIQLLKLNGSDTNGTLGVKDIYPKEIKFWGVRIKFIKSGKTLWSTVPINSDVYPIIPSLWYDLVKQETDGLDIQVTQFFSDGRGASLLSYSTVNPESVGDTIYPVYAPSGEITTINVNYGGSVSKIYVPNDGNNKPTTHMYYEYSSTQWWDTVVKDVAGLGIGRFKSLDAYIIGVSSEIVNGVREYKRVFEKRLPLDEQYAAKVTQGSSNSLYNVSLGMGEVFVKDTNVLYFIFFVNRDTTNGAQYVTLEVNYDQKYIKV